MTAIGDYLSVDIGATKIAVGIVTRAGRVRARLRVPTPRGGGAAVLDAVAAATYQLRGDRSVVALGVGAPGVIDPASGAVRSATDLLPAWAGTPVRAGLRQRTGLPVAVDNDVRAMALGEARHGAGRGYADALYVSVGTGIGGALLRAGRLVRGPHGMTGELAHLPTPHPGAVACGCGRDDHIEAVGSGPAIEAAYRARGGGHATLRVIAERARAGEQPATRVIEHAATALGQVLAGLVCAVDVSAVVIGGGVAQIGASYLGPLAAALRSGGLPDLRRLPVLAARLGTDAPLVGAAALAGDLIAAGGLDGSEEIHVG